MRLTSRVVGGQCRRWPRPGPRLGSSTQRSLRGWPSAACCCCYGPRSASGAPATRPTAARPALGVVLLAGWVLYEPLGVAWRGQTLGKAICRIRVVRSADGATPSVDQAFVRWMVPAAVGVVSTLAAAVALASVAADALRIGLMFVAWAPMYLTSFLDADRLQGWHDKAARTMVVSAVRQRSTHRGIAVSRNRMIGLCGAFMRSPAWPRYRARGQ